MIWKNKKETKPDLKLIKNHDYFMDKNIDYKKDLASKLEELKKIEGFPLGTDEDILALSQPPYYTACPNPYIKDFINEYGTPYDEKLESYNKTPYTDDIDTNKNDKLTNAHSYHTKSPFHAIQQYIEHYTKKGDIVLDCFTGSGMTGIAAQKSGRKAILLDLSPIASYLAFNYNTSISSDRFLTQAGNILEELEKELGWLYETLHSNGEKAVINSIIFSENYKCPICNTEFILWDFALNRNEKKVDDPFICKTCNASIKKSDCEKVFVNINDKSLNETFLQSKVSPVEIVYTYKKKRYKKTPDKFDLALIEKIDNINIPFWHPTNIIPEGHNLNQPIKAQGYKNVHHFFTRRNLYALSALFSKISLIQDSEIRTKLKITFNSLLLRASRKAILGVGYYFNGGGGYIATISGNWYIPSLNVEVPVFEQFKNRVKKVNEINLHNFNKNHVRISTQSSTDLSNIPENSIDFIFVDPPFGENLMYSELNFLYESWNGIITNQKDEAIMNSVQNKGIGDYNQLMRISFSNLFRILKPQRWITIEYHNSSSLIWNGLQESLTKAGFVIAHTSILKNKGGSFIINVSPNSVSNDLMISAYKPDAEFTHKFIKQAGADVELEFIKLFLENLPPQPMIERTEKMLYSKMVAYYLQKGYQINLDAKTFYEMLFQNFISQDGFWFTKHQIESYQDFKKQMKLRGETNNDGNTSLFIIDEKSAILWLQNFVSEPKSFSDISTAYTKLSNIRFDIVPDLKILLEENFSFDDEMYSIPTSKDYHISLLEKRNKTLKREFETILIQAQTQNTKIKLVRKEALAYGFELCYKEKRFADILNIAQKLDNSILENSGELNDFIEAAEIMIEGIQ